MAMENSDLVKRFEDAVMCVSRGDFGKPPPQDEALMLYGYYARVKKGVCPPKGCPNVYLDPRGHLKWKAWENVGDASEESAMLMYISVVDLLRHKVEIGEIKPGSTSSGSFGDKSSQGFDVPDEEGSTRVQSAEDTETDISYWVSQNNLDTVMKLVKAKGTLNDHDEDSMTPLMRAADRGYFEMVTWMLLNGAEVGLVDDDGQTALHYATMCEHHDVVRALVLMGADPYAKDNEHVDSYSIAPPELKKIMLESVEDHKKTPKDSIPQFLVSKKASMPWLGSHSTFGQHMSELMEDYSDFAKKTMATLTVGFLVIGVVTMLRRRK